MPTLSYDAVHVFDTIVSVCVMPLKPVSNSHCDHDLHRLHSHILVCTSTWHIYIDILLGVVLWLMSHPAVLQLNHIPEIMQLPLCSCM